MRQVFEWLIFGLIGLSLMAGCNAGDGDVSTSQPVWTANQRNMQKGVLQRVSLPYEGLSRSYLIYVPRSYNPSRPTPLILVFHGGLGNAARMPPLTGMNELAEEKGFIVVYPNGIGRDPDGDRLTWNAGGCCGAAQRRNVDDVGFTRTIIEQVSRQFRIDAQRVYATGISNGAMMAYRLACDLSDRISAIAPVAGASMAERCNPQRPIPVIHFHGLADQNAPFRGGMGARSVAGVPHRSVPDTINGLRQSNECQKPGRYSRIGDAQFEEFSCRRGGAIVLVTIEGGGHTWPGGQRNDSRGRNEYSSRSISASREMWRFFDALSSMPNASLPGRQP
jgi:polyhydroxybutyrate depolymerase